MKGSILRASMIGMKRTVGNDNLITLHKLNGYTWTTLPINLEYILWSTELHDII